MRNFFCQLYIADFFSRSCLVLSGSCDLSREWGHLDSNQEPTSYEPAALTVELCPQKEREKIAIKQHKEHKKIKIHYCVFLITFPNCHCYRFFQLFLFFQSCERSKPIRAKSEFFSRGFIHVGIEIIGHLF